MKDILFAVSLILASMKTMAAIEFKAREYLPKGKNYNLLKSSSVIYFYFKPQKGTDVVWILYAKSPSNDFYLTGIVASKSLEQKIPPKILSFIGSNIVYPKLLVTKSLEAAKEALRTAVNKALDPTWLNALTNDGDAYVNREEYNRDYAGFDMNYYEFFPIEKNDLANPTSIDNKELLKSFFEDEKLKTEKILLEKSGVVGKVEDSNLKKPDFDRSVSWQKYRYDNLMDVANELKSAGYHHKSLKVSDWPQASKKNWGLAKSIPNDFHLDIDSTCRYLMVLQPTLKKRELMPAMAWKQNYGDWKATRCNLFVGDFAMQKLNLPTYPWGTTAWNANVIYDELPKDKNFVLLSWNEAWFYASIGYPVFITTPKPDDGPAAHIGFAYPIDLDLAMKFLKNTDDTAKNDIIINEKVITLQSGSKIGKMPIARGFGSLARAKIYVYLGYLLN